MKPIHTFKPQADKMVHLILFFVTSIIVIDKNNVAADSNTVTHYHER